MQSNQTLSAEQLSEHVTELFSQHMPFNQHLGLNIRQHLGLNIRKLGLDEVEIRLPWDDKLMGNPIQKFCMAASPQPYSIQ